MSLKFELLQADDYSRYLLRGRTDILFNLRGLMQKRAMLSAFIDASADSFLTAIVALSADDDYLVLDAASDEQLNRRIEIAEQLICVTQLDKIKIQFAARGLVRITHAGHAAFVLDGDGRAVRRIVRVGIAAVRLRDVLVDLARRADAVMCR